MAAVATILLQLALASCGAAYDVETVTALGTVGGKRIKVLDRELEVYRGIPYAQPPLGPLRFRPPQPHEGWEGVLDATSRRTGCPQAVLVPVLTAGLQLTEDCLHLNIWTPVTRRQERVPVLVSIHAGGFSYGSSSAKFTDCAILTAKSGFVVVSFNYRLDILGFLDANTTEAPGNVGLMDQNLALKWIQTHIKHFGGDPFNVTIFGVSAGGMSAHAHVISPMSRGLFKRAAMMSGTQNSPDFVENWSDSRDKGDVVAMNVGCADDVNTLASNPESVLACLRTKSAEELVRATKESFSYKIHSFMPTYPNQFLPQDPAVAVKEGAFNPADLIVSVTADEGAAALLYPPRQELLTENIEGFDETLLNNSLHEMIFSWLKVNSSRVLATYISQVQNKTSLRRAYVDFFSDRTFVCPMHLTAEGHSRRGQSVYSYVFSYRTERSPWPAWVGTPHGDDSGYIYGLPFVYTEEYDSEDAAMSETIIHVLSSFASTGVVEEHGLRMAAAATVLLLLAFALRCAAFDVETVTSLGTVGGKRIEVLDRELEVYRGIPYAQPPLGPLRFRSPQPHQGWEEVELTEDCLHLNIWTPVAGSQDRVPVLVSIHGGGFSYGSSSADFFDSTILAAKTGFVVVSFNYRLDILGFLDANTTEAPGNVGLMDQNLALKWIQAHIHHFGGDPSNVTIFGVSAGGMSVHAHVISPVSRGLFKRAAMMSGTQDSPDFVENWSDSRAKGNVVAMTVGCADDVTTLASNPQSVLACLRTKSAEELVRAASESFKPRIFSFLPTYPNQFLPQEPAVARNHRRRSSDPDVPSETGLLAENVEGLHEPSFNSSLHEVTFSWLKVNSSSVLGTYLSQVHDLASLRRAYVDFLSDRTFVCPMHFTAEAHSKHGQSVYSYVFSYRTAKSPWPAWVGAPHGEDLGYIYGFPFVHPEKYEAEDAVMSETIINMLSSFASTGVPQLPMGNQWPKYTEDNPVSIFFTKNNITEVIGFRKPFCNEWRSDRQN
ncbi:hypothetical protein HPB50_004563 [Hyalomma asiaticum]|uniref:Uncharacterized protein n=1 Tax=Hyalomma asiaticum TaxID=266040 RepID=A0ACB7RLY5_HYAAI|nr:hypothetical protein HPB50_004563 [Hyalomma asiaticum]